MIFAAQALPRSFTTSFGSVTGVKFGEVGEKAWRRKSTINRLNELYIRDLYQTRWQTCSPLTITHFAIDIASG